MKIYICQMHKCQLQYTPDLLGLYYTGYHLDLIINVKTTLLP